MSYQTAKDAIDLYIQQNGVGAITGPVLNDVLTILIREIPEGPQGDKGEKGDDGESIKGDRGSDGLDAIQAWLNRNQGKTLNDYIETIRGPRGFAGPDAISSWLTLNTGKTLTDYIAAIRGIQGEPGVQGPPGPADSTRPALTVSGVAPTNPQGTDNDSWLHVVNSDTAILYKRIAAQWQVQYTFGSSSASASTYVPSDADNDAGWWAGLLALGSTKVNIALDFIASAIGKRSALTTTNRSTVVAAINEVRNDLINHNHAGVYAELDGNGKLKTSQVPAITISDFLGSVASEVAMLALVGERGDWCTRTDLEQSYILIAEPSSVVTNWEPIATPGSGVSSVNGQTGPAVNLTTSDIAEGSNQYFTPAKALAAAPAETTATLGDLTYYAGDKLILADTDRFGFSDSQAGGIWKHAAFAAIKTNLRGFFDTLYSVVGHIHALANPTTGVAGFLSPEGRTRVSRNVKPFINETPHTWITKPTPTFTIIPEDPVEGDPAHVSIHLSAMEIIVDGVNNQIAAGTRGAVYRSTLTAGEGFTIFYQKFGPNDFSLSVPKYLLNDSIDVLNGVLIGHYIIHPDLTVTENTAWNGSVSVGGGSVDTVNSQTPDGSKNVLVRAQHIPYQPTDLAFFNGLLTNGELMSSAALNKLVLEMRGKLSAFSEVVLVNATRTITAADNHKIFIHTGATDIYFYLDAITLDDTGVQIKIIQASTGLVIFQKLGGLFSFVSSATANTRGLGSTAELSTAESADKPAWFLAITGKPDMTILTITDADLVSGSYDVPWRLTGAHIYSECAVDFNINCPTGSYEFLFHQVGAGKFTFIGVNTGNVLGNMTGKVTSEGPGATVTVFSKSPNIRLRGDLI